MRGRFGPLRGTAKRKQSSMLDVIFSHHSKGICLMTQDFFSRTGTARGCAHSQFQLIDSCCPVLVEAHTSTRCPGPAWPRCNGQTKICPRHTCRKLIPIATTNPGYGRESSVALLWKSGARVTKWAIRTYNGAGRSFARLSALPRWTPHPHPIQCDGFEPRRPHGGAFDSKASI